MMTKEELIRKYNERTKCEFEMACNYYVADYNRESVRNHTKQTTFFKTIEDVVRECGDKYNYTKLIEEHKQYEIQETRPD